MPPSKARKLLSGNAFQWKSLVYGKKRQFQTGRNTKLIEDVAEVVFHRIFADLEVFSDLYVRVAGYDRRDNFEFARS